jgi:predicted ABC-type ATPase
LEGGHYVAPETIKGVYQMNLRHINEFSETFKAINLFDGTIKPFVLVEMENNQIISASEIALKKNWIKKGLPAIAEKIVAFKAVRLNEIKKNRKRG